MLLLGCAISSDAQETWGLEQCIKYATDNNISIKQKELQAEISKNDLKVKQWSQAPSLSASGNQNVSFGRSRDNSNFASIDKSAWSGNFGIAAQMNLFSGFKSRAMVEQGKLDLQSDLLSIDLARNDLSLQIAGAYLTVLFSEEKVGQAEKQIEVSRMQVERTQKLVDAGNLSQSNLLTIKSQLAQEELKFVTYQNDLDIAYLALRQLLDLPADTPFKVDHPKDIVANEQYALSSPNQLFQNSQNLPQIQMAEVKVQSAEKGIKVAKSGYYPTLSFGAQYGTSYFNQAIELRGYSLAPDGKTQIPIYGKQPIGDQLDKNQSWGLGLSLNIPIFERMNNRYSVSNARVGYNLAQLNLQQEKNTLYKLISQAHADAVGALKSYSASQKALESVAESFNSIDKKFNVGAANSTDYNTAKNDLAKAESDVLQAKYQFIFKTKILDFYKGVPIKL